MRKLHIRWTLVFFDIFTVICVNLFCALLSVNHTMYSAFLTQTVLSVAVIIGIRIECKVYAQIWRYGTISTYLLLVFSDCISMAVLLLAHFFLPISKYTLLQTFGTVITIMMVSVVSRLSYRYIYHCSAIGDRRGKICDKILRAVLKEAKNHEVVDIAQQVRIAIVGAGNVGVNLCEELLERRDSRYLPCCFLDMKKEKIGREVFGLPVFPVADTTQSALRNLGVQEIVFAIPDLDIDRQRVLFETLRRWGFSVKVYDYPVIQTPGSKRSLREFDVEELLFRKTQNVLDESTCNYYAGKVIMITGGGGSIGSEICRQLAKMQPKQILILDIYENGAYDVQQELKIAYGNSLDLRVEIASVTNPVAMERIFAQYRPQIVVHAAAHKHVPFMEDNVIEAIENNVFGTKVTVELCEKYGVERFLMVSTDKAVNPTNVMGATKRMCEMIIQSASTCGRVKYSATRFGNVLGSAGSVIPLFKRQIANGGPITITDKRIIRYFMTIPEASQLVLKSGAMAQNGELFVLDMGKPVKIWDLAESMIRLSGARDIEIQEIGLRPGEKLYEELLIQNDNLEKTSDSLIYVEKDLPLSPETVENALEILKKACASGQNDVAREALHQVVPTFRKPEEVNREAQQTMDRQCAVS